MSSVEHWHTKEQYCCSTELDEATASVPGWKKVGLGGGSFVDDHILSLRRARGTEVGRE